MFEFKEPDDRFCDACNKVTNELTLIECSWSAMNLCDNCIQQLNRKIVDYLAEKNI